MEEEEEEKKMTSPPRTRRVWAGLATFAACIGAVVLLVSVHDSSGDPPSTHAPTSFYSSAAGDWTASPTARNLLGTGCQCNVQIVGGFNGSKGDTGKFETGGELLRAQLLNPNITGQVDGGATHVGATLRSAVVETGLGFKVGVVDSTKTVTIAPPDAMTIAGYTVKLPSVAPAANEFLQVGADGINTKWSNTLTTPTLSGASLSGATTITGAKFGGSTTFVGGATVTGATLSGATTFLDASSTLAFPTLQTGTTKVTLSPGTMSAGASATWSFPATAATDTLVGAGATQTLTDKTLAAPKLTGLTSLDRTSMLTIDPKTVACTGDQAGNVLTIAAGCSVGESQIGNVIVWANGDRATIIDTGPGSQTATLVGGSTRASSAFTLYTTLATGLMPTTQISNDAAVFKDRITLKTFISGGGTQAVTIDASNTAYTARHHAKWSFPHPGTTGPWDHRFVGADTVQTLTSKTLADAKMSGTTAFQAGSTITGARFEGTTTIMGSIAGQPRFAGSVSSAYPSSQSCEMNTTATGVVALKTGSPCGFNQFWVDVGTIIRWQDNTVSVVTRWLDTRTVETSPVGAAATAHVVRDFQFGNVHWGSWMFSAGSTHTTMQAPTMYSAKASAGVILSLDSMKALQMATWSFPKIDESARPSDTLVGASTAQTLANKKLQTLTSLEFKPDTAGIWITVNDQSAPLTWTPNRAVATGTTALDYYESLVMQMRVTGHLGTIAGDSTTARYLTARLARVGRSVTMQVDRLTFTTGARPAGTIGIDMASPVPTIFRPNADMVFAVPVVNNGVNTLGSLRAFASGELVFAAGLDFSTAFSATTVESGIPATAVQWVRNT